ncbi:hypothetical protein BCR35DRAFT_299235 [Leucosporidium creatinivorum]|uniref:Adenylate kinase n=1 Tax=Leucosporidium creatinivorum TaxID=106004 RepID=A0A1Y2G2Z3_9BASI|nr:hypothetical protein BCR35DRAFT_299235 [Leucosporidium creatinivorum]
MDSMLWLDDWVKVEQPVLAEKVAEAAQADDWCSDGVYFSIKDSFYPRATDVIWLDYPLSLVLYRLVKRTWWRWWNQETLFGTNCRERWQETLFSRNSILWFCISRHDKLRRELPAAVEVDSLPLRRRFAWPSQTEKWVRLIEEARKGV